MADCPGVLHLAEMADGGLARVRLPGGRLTAEQAGAVADIAERLGSGVVDLTNRANLQIRGLALDAGVALATGLAAAGLFVDGPADRRRNLLLDPLSGLDPTERMDMRELGAAMAAELTAAPWIENLSPKFSVVLDGGGRSGVAAAGADVAFLAVGAASSRSRPGLAIRLAAQPLPLAVPGEHAVAAAVTIARMTALLGPDARARDVAPEAAVQALLGAGVAHAAEDSVWPGAVTPSYGVVRTADPARVALAIPVAVGRLDPAALRWLAEAAARHGEGALVLAPWSAVVIPGVQAPGAAALLAAAKEAGFPPVAVAERLTVIACAGAPACVRAREPAKAIGRALLDAAIDRPDLLPRDRRSVHVSACAKGCAGSAPADLLLLGSSNQGGFSLHAGGAPRRPGGTIGRAETASPFDLLARLAAKPGAGLA